MWGMPIAKSLLRYSALHQGLEPFDGLRITRMDIRFVSSLTAEDENLFAPALLKAVGALLDQLPIAYTVRIETTGAQVFQHSHAVAPDEPARVESFGSVGSTGNLAVASHYARRAAQ
jgi:hypothetical protein